MLLALVSFIYWLCGTGIIPARFTGRVLTAPTGLVLALASQVGFSMGGSAINPARFTGRELALLRTTATGWCCNR